MTARMTVPKPVAAAKAEKAASLPKRQVIAHDKLFQASLQVQRAGMTDALSAVDRELVHASDARNEAREAAKRAYEMTCAFEDQKFEAIRADLDIERDSIIRTLDGIDAALAKVEPSNVVPLKSAAE